MVRFTIGNLAYAAAIGVAYLSAPVSLLVAMYYAFEQTPGRGPTPAGGEPRTGE